MPKNSGFVNENMTIHPLVRKSNGKLTPATHNQISFPYVDMWSGWRKIQSKTAIQNMPVNDAESQFDLHVLGYLHELYVELEITENNTGNSRFNPYNLWQRIEIEADDGKLFRTLYPDLMFQKQMLFRDRDYHERIKNVEGLQSNFSPNTITVAQNTTQKFFLKLDIFDGSTPNLTLLKKPLLFKFYWQLPANFVIGGTSQNLSIRSMNLLAKQLVPKYHHKPGTDITYRYLNFVRQTHSKNLQPSTEYDFQLNAFNGFSSYIFFMVRPAPVSTDGANWDTYQAIDNFELRDKNSQIIAIKHESNFNRYVVSDVFNSEFLNTAGKNIYVIPFSMDPEGSEHGAQTGGMMFTTDEILHIVTPSTLVAGNFDIVIWSANYEYFDITTNGRFESTH